MGRWIAVGLFLLGAVGVALAAPDCAVVHCISLPIVQYNPPPTIAPTPIPPVLSTLVIQPGDIQSGYAVEQFHEVTNADAAQTYKDPKATLKAFAQQGRESSWFVLYDTTLYAASDAIGISDQVYRYSTAAGATTGQAYALAETQRDKPDFHAITLTLPCCSTKALDRSFLENGVLFEQAFISIQVGRYVADVQVLWARSSTITVEQIVAYAQTGADHLLATPQGAGVPVLISAPDSPQAMLPRNAMRIH